MHDGTLGMGWWSGLVFMIPFWILGILLIVFNVIGEMSHGRKVKGKFLKKRRQP